MVHLKTESDASFESRHWWPLDRWTKYWRASCEGPFAEFKAVTSSTKMIDWWHKLAIVGFV